MGGQSISVSSTSVLAPNGWSWMNWAVSAYIFLYRCLGGCRLDAPLSAAADLDRGDGAGADQGVGLALGDVQQLR